MADGILELRGGLEPLVSVKLRGTDLDDIRAALVERISQAPGFFRNAPIVVDGSALAVSDAEQLDINGLLRVLADEGLQPVAARSTDEALIGRLRAAGLAMLANIGNRSRSPRREPVPEPEPPEQADTAKAATEPAAPATAEGDAAVVPVAAASEESAQAIDPEPVDTLPEPPLPVPALVVERPVRSGQRHYAPQGDLVVMSQVGGGAELIAAGSIHVYGALRGRALCGAHGDTSARIYCLRMEAELVSVAGTYRSLDDLPENVAGKAATIWLDGDTLRVDPL